ncbi:hypothetical protein [uncultured Gimesia sp.]|uniref:EF-hand domain-containing protein n=1 Tax=uncultured Gimesia sp. TaxID=1678688 RepID=UPI0026305096|nr:hypothetical protein [uncultured Gimesia sp.]
MRKFGFLLTLFALMIFASDAYAQRGGGGGGGRGGGGGQRGGGGGGGGQRGGGGGGQGGGGQQMGQGGGGQCQQGGGGGGSQMRQGGGMQNGMNQGGTVDTVEVLTQVMARMDQNRDGMISRNEVPPQLQTQMAGADLNGDGTLNRLEQMAVLDRAKILSGRPDSNGSGLNSDIFQKLDKNRDNAISPAEVPRPLQRLFRTLDTNQDGSVDAEEQKAAIEQIKSKLNPEVPRVKQPQL